MSSKKCTKAKHNINNNLSQYNIEEIISHKDAYYCLSSRKNCSVEEDDKMK